MGIPAAQGGAGPPIIPPPKAKPRPIVSARGNIGASQPAGTAKLGPPPGVLSGLGQAIGHIGASAQQAAQSVGTPHLAGHGGTDVQSGGYNNFAQADQYKNSSAYKNAILNVFKAQSPTAQRALVLSASRQPTAEGNLILDHLKTVAKTDLFSSELNAFRKDTGPLGAANHFEQALTSAGQGLSHLIDFLPSQNNGTPIANAMQATAGGSTPADVLKNAGKDLVNLPAEVGPSVVIPAKQALSGDVGGALKTITQPFVNAVEHPQQALEQHPLNTYLLAGGPIHGITRVADQGARAIVGKPADLQRPSVQLTGNLTKERPNYSKFPVIRGQQKTIERQMYKPSGDQSGAVVPRARVLGVDLRNKEIRQGVSQRVGMNERIRRVEVTSQERAHAKAVLAPKPQQVAHGVKTALAYNPAPALIKGANVLSLIAQGVIRRPDTALLDLQKHIGRVQSQRSSLLDFPKALAEHDQYVKRLMAEQKSWKADKNLPRSLQAAFAASDKHAAAYGPLEAQAHDFGHFGKGVTKDMLERRALTPIVEHHMPGARFDPTLNTMVADLHPAGAAMELDRLQQRAKKVQAQLKGAKSPGEAAAAERGLHATWLRMAQVETRQTRVLTTQEMRDFAARQTGGRPLSYGSHQAPRGDSAFYVSGQKFPAKAVQRNTMFAFTHGLTDPGHESLLGSRVHMQGVVSAHKSMGRILGLLAEKQSDGSYWRTYKEARQDAPAGYVPVNVGRIHGTDGKPTPSDAHNASDIETEALRHSLDLNARLHPSEETGKWALIHTQAVDQLRKHENQISPNALLRGFRGSTGQFRRVALGTSAKHIPGVFQENLIRDIASGVFVHHWIAERNVYKAAAKINPQLAAERRIEQTGGQVSGATRALQTRQVSRHFAGTALEGPLRGFEAFIRAPGPRQLGTAWNAWLRFAIDGTKRVLEEQHQRAAVGKQLLNDFGGLMRLQGDAAKQAAVHGYLPDAAARRLRAGTERMFGKWTDLTPEAQTALMVSPFGMWWVNSVKWLARLPVDHPIGTSLLAAANVGTEQQRQKLGLDMFSPQHLPLYEQGGIPSGGNILAQNYYSPFGVANDPLETAQSLILPTLTPQVLASLGDNWLGRQMKSPQHPHGGETNVGQRAAVIVNSLLGMFVPLYQKAQTIAQGGASSYDTSTLFRPQTKGRNPGVLPGLEKSLTPIRKYKNVGNKGSAPAGSGWGGGSSSGGSSGSSSGGGGWGGGSSGSSGSGGWG